MVHRADLTFELADPEGARAVARALALEVADGPGGCTTLLRVEGATVHAGLEAGTVSGLRAALNGTVRLLDAAVRTL